MAQAAYLPSSDGIKRSTPVSDKTDDASSDLKAATERLVDTNELLAEWAAASTEDSPALVERLERMGYEVRGKSREDVSEVLKHPPTRRNISS
jgi:hypothetical protein